MRALLLVLVMSIAAPAWAVTAIWTGHMRKVQTVSFKWAFECEYAIGADRHMVLIPEATVMKNMGWCPKTIELE